MLFVNVSIRNMYPQLFLSHIFTSVSFFGPYYRKLNWINLVCFARTRKTRSDLANLFCLSFYDGILLRLRRARLVYMYIMFSGCKLSVRSSVRLLPKIVNAIFWERINRLWRQLAQVVCNHAARVRDDQLWEVSRSKVKVSRGRR